MSIKYQLDFLIEGQSTIQIEGDIIDKDLKILEMFLMQYDELSKSGPLQKGLPCHIVLNFNETEGLSSTGTLPSKDELSILLHLLRPFILHNEPASFDKCFKIIKNHFLNSPLQSTLTQARELYDGSQSQKMMKVSSNEEIINSDKILKKWLNSYEYHRDLDKREAIDRLFEFIPGNFLNWLFVSLIMDKIDAIRIVAKIVKIVLGRESKLQFTI